MSDAITIDGVSKRYGRHVALDDVSLTVPEGEVVGLIGPNGAGKTTLLKALVGLRRVTSGEIRLPGGGPGDDEALAGVGVLIDEPGLWPHLSGVEHVRVHARLRGVPAAWGDEALARVGLADAGRKRVKAYSLGMRWRLGIAIALTSRPRILVLDEPTNGLDPIGVREMRRLLADLAGAGVSILVSSHNLTEMQHVCSRIVVLVDGRVRFRGRTDELARGGDLEQAFFALVAEAEPAAV